MAFIVFTKVGKGQLLSYAERFLNEKAFSKVVCSQVTISNKYIPCCCVSVQDKITEEVKMW